MGADPPRACSPASSRAGHAPDRFRAGRGGPAPGAGGREGLHLWSRPVDLDALGGRERPGSTVVLTAPGLPRHLVLLHRGISTEYMAGTRHGQAAAHLPTRAPARAAAKPGRGSRQRRLSSGSRSPRMPALLPAQYPSLLPRRPRRGSGNSWATRPPRLTAKPRSVPGRWGRVPGPIQKGFKRK